MGNPKLELDIETALKWAYQRELLHHDGLFAVEAPKLASPGWVKMIDTGTAVDFSHDRGRFPIGAGPPHPDALALDFFVRALPDVRVDWRRERHALMGELAPYLSDDDPLVSSMRTAPIAEVNENRDRRGALKASARMVAPAEFVPVQQSNVRDMVALHARLGNRPIWDTGHVRLVRCHPVMVGRQTGKRRYTFGSHCPLKLDPPAQEIACARWEYSVWHKALATLASVRLSTIVLLPPKAPARPWIAGSEGRGPARRVLRDPAAASTTRLRLKPERELALLPVVSDAEEEAMRHRKRRRRSKLTTPATVA